MGAKGKTTIRHQQMESRVTRKNPMGESKGSQGQWVSWATSDAKSALTAEDPAFPLCTSPEAEAFPGHGDGSVQCPPLLPDVIHEPG